MSTKKKKREHLKIINRQFLGFYLEIYEVIYYFHDQYGSLCERKEYSFRKFKSIEEFDPIDFFEEGE